MFDNFNINREDISYFLVNNGQNEVGPNMIEFANNIPEISTIDDIKFLFNFFMNNLKRDRDSLIKKFERTSEEIFSSKIWSGCSDVGTAIAPILRLKNIPTIYLQSAHIDWINDLNEHNENENRVRGHIFLEIFLNNEWLLFDATNGHLYLNYDYNNPSLPDGYYAFSKSLNGHELGYISLRKNNEKMKKLFMGFDINNYIKPNYTEISLKKGTIMK